MPLTQLTDDELDVFLADPNAFLADPDRARRALGITPASKEAVRESLIQRGMTPVQADKKLEQLALVKDIVEKIVTTLGKDVLERRTNILTNNNQ